MALALAGKYSNLSVSGLFKDPMRRDEESLGTDQFVDINLASTTFAVPPGIEVCDELLCILTI